jgi:hypothetical protein
MCHSQRQNLAHAPCIEVLESVFSGGTSATRRLHQNANHHIRASVDRQKFFRRVRKTSAETSPEKGVRRNTMVRFVHLVNAHVGGVCRWTHRPVFFVQPIRSR